MSTGLSSLSAHDPSSTLMAKLADYAELTKPKIVAMELVAVLAAMHIATGYGAPGTPWNLALMLGVALGTGLIAGSANALNQWLERENDARMIRTAGRPIPSGRMAPAEAVVFSIFTLAMGGATLWILAGAAPAIVAIVTWVLYVALYTPMKTRTWLNTAVGAVSGATPLWIGWTAGGGSLSDSVGLSMVAVMYVWQFPHFMAIAWICRDDYARADYQMSTTRDPSGWWAGVQAIVGSAILLSVSLAPLFQSDSISPFVYAPVALVVGFAMLGASASFFAKRDDTTARRLMRISLIYVPAWLVALWASGV